MTVKQFQELVQLYVAGGDSLEQAKEKAIAFLGDQKIVDADGKSIEVGDIQFVTAKAVADDDADDESETIEEAKAKAAKAKENKAAKAPVVTGGNFRNDDTKRFGWSNFGEFALGVRKAASSGVPQSSWDKRLMTKAPTTYGNEGVGADGGFAVPPEYRDQIMQIVLAEDSLLSRTDMITTSKNSVVIPTDETTPWQTSGGILGAWLEEAALKSQSKPALKNITVRLNKYAVLVPITDELLEDSAAMSSYVTSKAATKIDFAVNLALVQGTGAGQPLGIINSPAAIQAAAVESQVADTVVGLNIIAMWTRLYAPYRRNAVWLANQDVEPQLQLLMKSGKLDTGAADTGWGIGPLYYDENGPTLKGRPVIYTQATETLGDVGDLILWDPTQYLSLVKGGGVRSDVSMHLWFDYDVTAFRFVLRVGGQPWLSAPIAARDGSATYSSIVTLAAR